MSQPKNKDLKDADIKDRLHILHVDDDITFLEVTKEILELEANFEIDWALSVDEALQKLEKQPYDAVISDYEMPQKNGLQFLQQLREKNNSIPFVIFTGKGREEVAIKALNFDADGYYNKQGSPETVMFGELSRGIRSAVNRKKTEEALRLSEKNYSELFNGMSDMAWVIDFDANLIAVNDTAVKILGYSKQELLSMRTQKIDYSLSKEQIRELGVQMPADQVQVYETTYNTKDGKIIPVEISLSLINYHEKNALLSVARNITKRKKAEQDILNEKAKAERYLDIVGNMVLVLDAQGKITLLNRKGYEILGYVEGELNGKNWIDTCLPKEMREKHTKLFESVVQGKAKTLTQYENPIVTKNGELRLISWINTELRDKACQIVGTLSSGEDITEHKKTEEELEKNQLRMRVMNEKLHVIGELTRHDARNKLSVIMMHAFMLKQKYGDHADIVDRLRKIEMASESIEKIFDFAKIYEQLGAEKLSFIDVGKAVNEAVSLFPDLTIKVINDCNGLTVLADSLLKLLFYNFIDNTIKHSKKATRIRVYFDQANSNKLQLIYEDDGVGISAENKLNLFAEGFSTGGSSGFGLFLICKMMDVYGWQIQEVGEPGKGVKFVITILTRT